MAEKDTRNIHQRILDTMKVVQYVKKDRVKGLQYAIVSHDEVTAACRGELLKNGVHYYSSVDSITQNGNRTECLVTTTFVNAESGQSAPSEIDGVRTRMSNSFSVTMAGYGIDTQDKGPGKAISYACKYALLKTLGLATGEDSDYHNEDYDAAPGGKPEATPPELKEVTRQATEGRPAMVESVQALLVMDDPSLEKKTALKLAKGLSAMIGVYYGPEGWFTKYIQGHKEWSKFCIDGDPVKSVARMHKKDVVSIFKKYRLRALDMADFNKYDHTLVGGYIRAHFGQKAGVDIYSLTEKEFNDMVSFVSDELKGGG